MSTKFVLYRRTSPRGKGVSYTIKSLIQYGEILNRASERGEVYEREVLAESTDLALLYQMRDLAEGEEAR